MSLSKHLAISYALAFFLLLGASFLLLYGAITTVFENRMDEDLAEDIQALQDVLSSSGVQGVINEMDRETLAGEHETVFLILYEAGGAELYSTNLSNWSGLEPEQHLVQELFRQSGESEFRTLSLPTQEAETRVVYGRLSPGYVMVIGESIEEQEEILQLLALTLGLVFLLSLPIASLLVLFLTRRAITGIQSVSNAAEDISSGNLDRRVNALNQVNEVQTLADTFDAMAARIQSLIRNMHEMTDNIAHDLRSPLGRIRLLSESVLQSSTSTDADYRQAAENTIAECDRLISMINTSLDVAEIEAGVTHDKRRHFDLTSLVEDACDLFSDAAEQKQIIVQKYLAEHQTVFGDLNDIQRMIANVLDNAVKYTPPGGLIRIRLEPVGKAIELSVRNSGEGINEADCENIFNRFYQVERSRTANGCGLGLSYSRAVARAHRGDIKVNAEPGSFAEFIIRIPSADTMNRPKESPSPTVY